MLLCTNPTPRHQYNTSKRHKRTQIKTRQTCSLPSFLGLLKLTLTVSLLVLLFTPLYQKKKKKNHSAVTFFSGITVQKLKDLLVRPNAISLLCFVVQQCPLLRRKKNLFRFCFSFSKLVVFVFEVFCLEAEFFFSFL